MVFTGLLLHRLRHTGVTSRNGNNRTLSDSRRLGKRRVGVYFNPHTSRGVEGEDIGTGQTLCPDCAQVVDALNVCGLGPESLRELFDTLRVFGPSEVKAKMEALRGLGVQMDMQERSQLN